MKKILFAILPLIGLTSCFEDVDNTLGRDQFLGNYELALTCTGYPSSNHIIFIEKPAGGDDTLSSSIVIRNLLDQNQTTMAVVSQNDFIFSDDTIVGTGSISDDANTITLSIVFDESECTGKGTRK